MFKFLKEKLGSWIKKSKETIEEKEEEVEEEKEDVKEEVKEIVEEAKEEVKEEKKELKDIKEEVKEQTKGKLKPEETVGVLGKEVKQAEKELKEAEENLKEIEKEKPGFFAKIKKKFTYRLNQEDFEKIFQDLEMLLLENNVALEAVDKIKLNLQEKLIDKEIKKQEIGMAITSSLKKALEEVIIEPDNILDIIKKIKEEDNGPFTMLFFGINGIGKTTSIAKFAHLLKKNNISCVLAAADTFRAASIEQLQIHADKIGVKMIKHDYGSDPAAVAFDAIKYAKGNKIDVVLIDTAGRMHTKDDLLREMEKICKVADPNLKIFVAEAIAGNDATEQADAFNKAIQIDGTILAKADIDEKGGTIISISHITNKPIFYLGTGQNYEDLELFNKQDFIKKLGIGD